MSTITNSPVNPAIPAAVACIQSDIWQLKVLMTSIYMRNFARFWNTPAGTPDPVSMAAAFGTQAALLVAQSAALATFINTAFPGTIPTEYLGTPSGWTLTSNADGTVTITKAS
jgi:hypothetical protein